MEKLRHREMKSLRFTQLVDSDAIEHMQEVWLHVHAIDC